MTEEEVHEVHRAVEAALAAGSDDGLAVLGYGEISMVVGWPGDAPARAYKRLPRFPDRAALEAYATVFERYLGALADRGMSVLPSRLLDVPGKRGAATAYVMQTVLPADQLAPSVLRRAEPDPEHPVVASITRHVADVVGPELGLDAQLSNWAQHEPEGGLRYFDVTTPLLAGPDGRSALDVDLFLAATPWAMRGALRRWVLPSILARYHDPRVVLLDLAANLYKERLVEWVPAVVAAANRVLPPSTAPITVDEVSRDYASDARQWELLLRVRRADRWWQRKVRRRPYPFLLPGHIER